MDSQASSTGWREYQAVLTLYLGIIIGGYELGFSAIAIPGIHLEVASNSTYLIPSVVADEEQLSWFGAFFEIDYV